MTQPTINLTLIEDDVWSIRENLIAQTREQGFTPTWIARMLDTLDKALGAAMREKKDSLKQIAHRAVAGPRTSIFSGGDKPIAGMNPSQTCIYWDAYDDPLLSL
jgi:hypothetical protein